MKNPEKMGNILLKIIGAFDIMIESIIPYCTLFGYYGETR